MTSIIFQTKKSFNLYIRKKKLFLFSNSVKYAIKAVLYLGVNSSEKQRIRAKVISEATDIPEAYASKLLQELSRHDVVSSAKGPHGGFYLTDKNRNTPLFKIVSLIDGEHRLTSCVLSLQKCDDSHPCPLHEMVGQTKADFLKSIQHTTVGQLIADVKEGKSYLPL
nr:Rrf2 family transcriptional regulator [Allomuricauda sp.]|tara:strand:+ start:25753 stop:26250 length:498 start_codon:yes stop_codon:yes gene_type:complete